MRPFGLLREGCRNFVVDLKFVSYVDSAGLSELTNLYSSVRREGAVLRVAGLDGSADLSAIPKLRGMFEVGPHKIFQTR